MLGTIVNTAAIVLGCLIGLILKKGIPQRATDAVMKGIALCVIYIGISGMLKGSKTLAAIIAMAAGGAVGTLIDLNGKFEKLGQIVEKTLVKGSSGIADGFVTASLIFCVGAMSVVGSLQSGLSADHSTLFTKSLIDGISAIVLTASLGIGVGLPPSAYLYIRVCSRCLRGFLRQCLPKAL